MTDPSQSRSARLSCRGHTLMEVILSTAMLCVIMGAVVSTMVIAGRAVDDNPVKQVAIAGDAANDVTTDISLAQSITESDANAVTMVVPDRDGDGQAETIRYSWSGTAGDPLMRQYNGGAEAVVASNVHRFNLSYLTTVVDGASGGDEGDESAEQLLISHVDATGGKFETMKLKADGSMVAEYFKPTLEAGATSWKITYIKLSLTAAGGDTGVVAIQIRTANADHTPTSTVLGQATVYESALASGFSWVDVNLGPIADLDPDTGYCIVVLPVSGLGDTIAVEREVDGSPMPSDCDYIDYDKVESSWKSPDAAKDLRFYVYGTVTTGGS